MKVKQAKVGVAIKGAGSNTLDSVEWDMEFDAEKGILHVKKRFPKEYDEEFLIFGSNIAYLIRDKETVKETKTEPKKK